MKTEEILLDDFNTVVPIDKATKIVTRTLDANGDLVAEKWEDIELIVPPKGKNAIVIILGIIILILASLLFYFKVPAWVGFSALICGLVVSVFGVNRLNRKL